MNNLTSFDNVQANIPKKYFNAVVFNYLDLYLYEGANVDYI